MSNVECRMSNVKGNQIWEKISGPLFSGAIVRSVIHPLQRLPKPLHGFLARSHEFVASRIAALEKRKKFGPGPKHRLRVAATRQRKTQAHSVDLAPRVATTSARRRTIGYIDADVRK